MGEDPSSPSRAAGGPSTSASTRSWCRCGRWPGSLMGDWSPPPPRLRRAHRPPGRAVPRPRAARRRRRRRRGARAATPARRWPPCRTGCRSGPSPSPPVADGPAPSTMVVGERCAADDAWSAGRAPPHPPRGVRAGAAPLRPAPIATSTTTTRRRSRCSASATGRRSGRCGSTPSTPTGLWQGDRLAVLPAHRATRPRRARSCASPCATAGAAAAGADDRPHPAGERAVLRAPGLAVRGEQEIYVGVEHQPMAIPMAIGLTQGRGR